MNYQGNLRKRNVHLPRRTKEIEAHVKLILGNFADLYPVAIEVFFGMRGDWGLGLCCNLGQNKWKT